MSNPVTTDADHPITVTPEPFGRWRVECPCGHFGAHGRLFPVKREANRAGLAHLHDTAGCTCPPEVAALPHHPEAS